jgi:hypothetical protein
MTTEAAQVAEPPRIQVVTNENFEAYVAEKLPAKVPSPEETASAELEKVEAEKKKAEPEEIDHPDEKKKGRLNERFSELTEKRKAAEEAKAKAEAEAKAAREEREAIARERDELKAKYEPPRSDELGPKPTRAQFVNDEEFESALTDWAGERAIRETKAKEAEERQTKEREALQKSFLDRQEAFRKENPEYDAKIQASDVKVSEQVQSAILESDVGPALLLHLAENPDFAKELAGMTVGRALKALGRLEAKLEKQPEQKLSVADISKAPAPITPIKSPSSPVATNMRGSDEFHGTYEEYKAKRLAGKIK